MIADIWARAWRHKLGYLLREPGWSHDGSREDERHDPCTLARENGARRHLTQHQLRLETRLRAAPKLLKSLAARESMERFDYIVIGRRQRGQRRGRASRR